MKLLDLMAQDSLRSLASCGNRLNNIKIQLKMENIELFINAYYNSFYLFVIVNIKVTF